MNLQMVNRRAEIGKLNSLPVVISLLWNNIHLEHEQIEYKCSEIRKNTADGSTSRPINKKIL